MPTLHLLAAVFLLGLLVGSFLNVVIARLPVMMARAWRGESLETEPFNLITPRSRCPACRHPLAPWEYIPVLSYLWLRGRCSACRARIAGRYPLVELLTAFASALVVWRLGPSAAGAGALFFIWALIALAFIDLERRLLPDEITLPFLWLGLAVNLWGLYAPIGDAVIGAICGYGAPWVIYWIFLALTGKEGMGHGDFKLLAMIGAWLGWQALPFTMFFSALIGALTGIGLILFGGHARGAPIPFGPYLAGAGFVALLWGRELMAWYLDRL